MTHRSTVRRLVALVLVTACLGEPTASGTPPQEGPATPTPLNGEYTLDVSGDSVLSDEILGIEVQSIATGTGDTIVGTWHRLDRTDMGPFPVVTGSRRASAVTLAWSDSGVPRSLIGIEDSGTVAGRVVVGGLVGSAVLRPLGWDSAAGVPDSLQGWFDPGPRAVVTIRSDDVRDSDRTFQSEVTRRRLKADFAVITYKVGSKGFLKWPEIIAYQAAGAGIDAHSRLHEPGPLSAGRFAWEVIGSKSDLRAYGIETRHFVIPGPWTGASYFDSLSKLRAARGRLVKGLFRGVEGYVYPVPLAIPIADSVGFGFAHITLDNISLSNGVAVLRAAVRGEQYVEFLVHPYLANQEVMYAMLDSIAALQDSGALIVVSAPVALAARRDGAPRLRAAGGGLFGSQSVALTEDAPGACRPTSATLDSGSVALGSNCEMRMHLAGPPVAVAVAAQAWWRGGASDTLIVEVADSVQPALRREIACPGAGSLSYCVARIGGVTAGSSVTARFRHAGGGGTVRLISGGLVVQ